MSGIRQFLIVLLAGGFFRKPPAVVEPTEPICPRFLNVPFYELDGTISMMQFTTGSPDNRSVVLFNLAVICASIHEQGRA